MKNKKQLTNDQIDRLIFLLENEEKRSKKIINFREGLPAIDRTTFNAAIKKMPNNHVETIIDLVVKMNLYHKTGEPEHAAHIGVFKKAGYVADAVKLGKEYHKNKKAISIIYYVHDTDGDTVFYDKECKKIIKKITPKKGRAVIFDSLIFHSFMRPIKSEKRVVINFIVNV